MSEPLGAPSRRKGWAAPQVPGGPLSPCPRAQGAAPGTQLSRQPMPGREGAWGTEAPQTDKMDRRRDLQDREARQ